MNWETFFNMGGYAFYVWGSYAVATIVLGLNVWLPLSRYRKLKQNLKKRYETSS